MQYRKAMYLHTTQKIKPGREKILLGQGLFIHGYGEGWPEDVCAKQNPRFQGWKRGSRWGSDADVYSALSIWARCRPPL